MVRWFLVFDYLLIRISVSTVAAQFFASPLVSKVLATGGKLFILTLAVYVVLLFPCEFECVPSRRSLIFLVPFLFHFCSIFLSKDTIIRQNKAISNGARHIKKGANQLITLDNPLFLLVPSARIERATPGLGILKYPLYSVLWCLCKHYIY